MKHLFITLHFLFIFCLISCYNAIAQTPFDVDKWKDYIEEMADDMDEAYIENLYEELSILVDNPFEFNKITEEQLRRLPFLTDRQIASILTYKEKYGKMYSLYELKNIEGIDFHTLELLLPFVYIDDNSVDKRSLSVNNLFKYGNNELYIRYDNSFQQKKGYKPVSDTILEQYPNRKYLGEDFYHTIRYAYSFDERIQMGIVAEKDAGEPFMNSLHKGYDFYSFHLLIKDLKWLKSFVVGDYKLAFGQGLIISHDFAPSRTAILSQAERRNYGFRRSYSTNEYNFFRGVGGSIHFMGFDLNLFYSNRNLDGTTDSLLITSLKTDGLHRIKGDWDKRKQVQLDVYGANLRYALPQFSMGLTALTYSFRGKRFEPELKPYNIYFFRGEKNTNLSVDYMFKTGALKIYGETAISANKAMATLNGLQIQPVSYASFLLLYRNYSKRYQALFGNGFGQNSTVQNEEGVYLGMQFTPFPYWNISAFADVFRFPWLKYGVDAPSSGKEYMTQIEYNRGRGNSFLIRYRFKQKEKNQTFADHLSIEKSNQHRLRLQFIRTTGIWNLRTVLDGVGYDEQTSKSSFGWMIGQGITFQTVKGKLKGDIYAAYFHTDNSSVVVSSFERAPLYVYYKPSFYGEGLRVAGTLRYIFSRNLMLSLKLSSTHYYDRNTIGTGLEEIAGPDKTDLNLILRWKF